MIVPFLLFTLVGLGIFSLQNLVFFSHVHLRLLPLLVFCVGLRPSLYLPLVLALALGFLQDSFATTPFGLHLGGALVLVATARVFRRRLLLPGLGTQVLGSLVALILQEAWFQAITFLLGSQDFWLKDQLRYRGLEILGTALLSPIMYQLVQGLEKFLRRRGWWPLRETTSVSSF
jgi:rod shape-determining protein MreD